jgi:hypothetical protein
MRFCVRKMKFEKIEPEVSQRMESEAAMIMNVGPQQIID